MTNSLEVNRETAPTPGTVLATKPAYVTQVHVDGVSRTKDDLIVNMVKQLFHVNNFEDMILKTIEIQKKFESLQCFKQISMHIDTSKKKDEKSGYEITYSVVENRRIFGGINTFVGNNNDGSIAINASLPNINGRGESFQVMYQYGTKKTSGINVEFTKPLYPWTLYDPRISASLFQLGSDFPWSGFREVGRGLGFDMKWKYNEDVQHLLRWEGVWRDVSALSSSTSFKVREESGHSLKSSIKHILTIDRRTGTFIPESGAMVQLKQEYAGIGGNVSFHKHEVEFQYNLPLLMLTDVILQSTLRAGIMKTIHNNCISDRFFVGGPLSLRGYQIFGIGPHADGNALGANSYWICNMHMYSNLPFNLGRTSFGKYCKTHLFVNSGNIANISLNGDYYKNISSLFNNAIRFSVGAGLVIHIQQGARLEFHYSVPFNQQSGDKPDKGLQFGFGAQFV